MLPTTAPSPAALALAAERLASLRAALDAIGPTPCRATDPGGELRRERHHRLCEVAAREHYTNLGGGWRLQTRADANPKVGKPAAIRSHLLWDYHPPQRVTDPFTSASFPIPPDATAAQMAALWNTHITTEAAKAAATFAALLIPTE